MATKEETPGAFQFTPILIKPEPEFERVQFHIFLTKKPSSKMQSKAINPEKMIMVSEDFERLVIVFEGTAEEFYKLLAAAQIPNPFTKSPNKRFFVFGYNAFEDNKGGFHDKKGEFDTQTEAELFACCLDCDVIEIYDRIAGVEVGCFSDPENTGLNDPLEERMKLKPLFMQRLATESI